MAFVTIRLKDVDGHSRQALDQDRMVLGRSSKNGLAIKHTSISREHCAFVREGERWFVEDLGSANGTWVNADKLDGRVELKERDIVKAGQARLTYHAGDLRDDVAEAAIDLSFEDGPGSPSGQINKGPTRTVGENDPPEAIPCEHCHGWFSIAHRLAGDRMKCPHCQHSNIVPSMST